MADFDFSDAATLISVVFGIVYALYDKLKKKAEAEPPAPVPKRPVVAKPPAAAPVPAGSATSTGVAASAASAARPSAPTTRPAGPDPIRKKLADTFEALERDAQALAETVRHERATERFYPVLDEWLPARCREERARALEGTDASIAVTRSLMLSAQWLSTVLQEVRALIAQRRDPTLLPELGDADALAEQCYAPIVDYARSRDLPLTSARPVAQLTGFDLSIWTGFARTSLAPLFLPPDFFLRAAWWPAVAHEIGHDFLISVDGLRQRLGAELGLPPESVGTMPLRLTAEGLSSSELWRVHGAWLEELFCDVFGTLMCGPAYAFTMVELFSHQQDPREVLVVPFDGRTQRYDPHPPRHLRVHAAAWVLERAGFHADAKQVLAQWHARNALGDDPSEHGLLFFAAGRWLQLPFDAVADLTRELVERLYAGPLPSLGGVGLQDISGLDYGPHEHNEADRARVALLAGNVPQVRDPRAVIAGAVLATLEQPEKEPLILDTARRAIVAVGTTEQRPDAYTEGLARRGPSPGVLDVSPEAMREAIVLEEILRRRSPRLE